MWGRNRKAVEAKAPETRSRASCRTLSAKPASRSPRSRAWSSISATRRWRGSNCSTTRSIRCSTKPRRTSTCSTAASAGAIRRGCGSTPSRMWLWRGTSGAIVSCRTRGLAGRSWRNQTTSPRSSRRSPITSRPASSSASGRWRKTRGRCARDCIRACMAAGAASRWRTIRAFMFGLIAGCIALFAVLWVVASRLPH